MFPARRSRRPARGARRQPARRRRGADARRAAASCSSSAACRRTATAHPHRRTWPARARWCATASASCSSTRGPRGMPLAIEPLHPMYAADRACVNTLAHANDLCDELAETAAPRHRGRRLSRVVGPAARARDRARRRRAPSRLLAYHICDWLVPTTDLLNDRGMMGDGVIDLPRIRSLDGSRRLSRHARSRDLLGQQLVEARSGRSARDVQGAPSRLRVARKGRRRCAHPPRVRHVE